METVSDRLRWVLTRAGDSARSLSLKAGKSPNTVQKILERGGSANGDTIAALARAAGVSEAWLLTGRGSPDETTEVSPKPGSQPVPEQSPALVGESPLERALGVAFDHTRHTVGDLRAVQDALTDGSFRWQLVEGDLVDAARTWLDAAAGLRREGHPVSTVAILFRVTTGNSALSRELAAQRRAASEALGRAAAAQAQLPQIEESGPSGIRAVTPAGSTTRPKTANG